jgi:tetratricopeptide (TPR) repeat protein
MGKKLCVFFVLSCSLCFLQAQSLIDEAKAKYLLQQANEKLSQSLFEEAVVLFQQADSLSSAVFTASDYTNMAGTYFHLKQHKDALNICKKAISLDSLNQNAYFNLGLVYSAMDSIYHAMAAYEKVIRIDSTHTQACYNLAICYKQLRNYQSAIFYYKKITEIDPSDTKAYVNMGIAYGEIGNTDMLYECFQKAANMGDKEAQEFLTKTGRTW